MQQEYLLQDKDKFYNWVYPKYEETIMTHTMHPNPEYNDFELSQGQKYVKDFLVNSPYRAILLYHGLGTGKTCTALITTEQLVSQKHILLFIPASLKQNWLGELSYCGSPIYNDKDMIYKNYTFINYNSSNIKNVYSSNGIINNFYLGSIVNYTIKDINKIGKITKINNGTFNQSTYKVSNITVQIIEDPEQQDNIDKGDNIFDTLDIINDNVQLYEPENINPFDNKIIIFDEVHNYIVTLANILKKNNKLTPIQKVKKDVYEHLKSAVNCKIILLSGTPIVNNCFEISYISNILNGSNIIYKFQFIVSGNKILSSVDKIKNKILSNINFINYINIEFLNNYINIYLTFNPDEFTKIDNINNHILQHDNNILYNNIDKKIKYIKNYIEQILNEFNFSPIFIKIKKEQINNSYMPENNTQFINKFLISEYDPEYNTNYYKKVKNINIIKTLLAGKISYIKGEIPTKSIKYDLHIPMGQDQENKYIFVRNEEIQSSKKKSMKDDDTNLSSLRSKSRQLCNIFIPLSEINLDIFDTNDTDSDTEIENDNTTNDLSTNITKTTDINTKIIKFINTKLNYISKEDITPNIKELEDKLEDYETANDIENIIKTKNSLSSLKTIIILDKINLYTNKYSFMIDKLIKSKNKDYIYDNKIYPAGKVLIYSDFRELKSGGVNFIGQLLLIEDLQFISFDQIFLNDEIINSIFVTVEEKIQLKNAYFTDVIKNRIIEKYQELIDNTYSSYKNNIFYLWKTSDPISLRNNYMAHIIFNSNENKNGNLLRTIFITKSGSEGISFKAIRQIHIIEPYWQLTRNTQVVGRGIRTGSHNQLDKSKHNVFIYNYLSTFKNDTGKINLLSDNNLTTDQYITAVSFKKQSIINTFYNIIKSVSLDCPYNNENIQCFSFNNIAYNNTNDDPIYLTSDIDSLDIQNTKLPAQLIIINNNKYILHSNILYDYEKYQLHNILIKIGHIDTSTDNLTLNITRKYVNDFKCNIPININTKLNSDIINNDTYGNITNKYTLINNLVVGGYGNNIPSYDSDDDDDDYSSDTDSDVSSLSDNNYDDDDDYDEDDEINDFNKHKNIYKNKEKITQTYNNIIFTINSEQVTYKNGDYIFLYDLFSNDKILAGKINKITNLYITINDIQIPIIRNNLEQLIILYKILSKDIFLQQISDEILNLHLQYKLITNIYDKYQQNNILDKIVTIINDKVKSNYKLNPINILTDIDKTKDTQENINPKILENIINIINTETDTKSDTDLNLTETSYNINSTTVLSTDFPSNNFTLDSSNGEIIIQIYTQILDNYYKLYYDLLEQKQPLYFSEKSINNKNQKSIKNIVINIISNELDNQYNLPLLEQNRKQYIELITLYFVFETSLNITSDELEFNLYLNKDFTDNKIKDLNNIINQENPLYKQLKIKPPHYFQYIKQIQTIEDTTSSVQDDNTIIDYINTKDPDTFKYTSELNLIKNIYNLKNTVKELNLNIDDIEALIYNNDSPIVKQIEIKNNDLLKFITSNSELKNIIIETTDKKKKEKKEKKEKKKEKKEKKVKKSKKNKLEEDTSNITSDTLISTSTDTPIESSDTPIESSDKQNDTNNSN